MSSSKNQDSDPPCSSTRRGFLHAGIVGTVMAAAAQWLRADGVAHESPQTSSLPVDGSTDPFPIPWSDRNGSHNQVPAPGQEPAHIFHFKGQIGRCNNFTGMGVDGNGRRIRFGGPTTDIGFMAGEYVATNGQKRAGVFAHI